MSKFTLNRDYTLASVFGHTVEFKKGVATHVPPKLKAEAIAIGALPSDPDEEPEVKKVEVPEGDDRIALVKAAMEDMAAANVREEFTAAGLPHAKVLSDRLGFTVGPQERDTLWAALKQGK